MKYFFLLIISIVQLPAQNSFNVEWENITGTLEGAHTVCMTEGKNGAVLIGTPKGCYRSTDKGQSWVKVNKGLKDMHIRALVTSSTGVLFAGTYTGVFRSTDNGEQWIDVTTGTAPGDVRFLYAHPQGTVFAGVTGKLYTTNDSGNTWKEYATGITTSAREYEGRIAFGKDGKIFTSFGDDIYWSTNGVNWNRYNQGGTMIGELYADSSGLLVDVLRFQIDASYSNAVPSIGNGVSYGSSLEADGFARLLYEGQELHNISGRQSGFLSNIIILPNQEYLISWYGRGIDSICRNCTKSNRGYNFRYSQNLPNKFISCLMRHSDGSLYAGSFGGGVYRTTDKGYTWTGSSSGLKEPHIFLLHYDISSARLFASTGSGFFYTSDMGKNWHNASTGLIDFRVRDLARSSKGEFYAAGWWGGLYASTNNGDSWIQRSDTSIDNKINCLLMLPGDTLLAGTQDGGFYRSANGGRSWKAMETKAEYHAVSMIDVPKTRGIFATSHTKILCSGDGGKTWKDSSEGFRANPPFTFLCRDSLQNIIGAEILAYKLNTSIAKPIWEPITTGYDSADAWSVCVNYTGDVFWASMQGAVIVDGTTHSWWRENKNLGSDDVVGITLDTSGYLYIGTLGGGVYRSKQSTTILEAPKQVQPLNNATGVDAASVNLRWEAPPRSLGYESQLSTRADFSSIVRTDTGIKPLNLSLKNLKSNSQYYWRVRSRFRKLASEWSPVWTFKTLAQLPKKLQLLSPPDKSTAQPVKTTLTWTGDDNAESYEVQVMDAVSQTVVYADSTLTVTSANLSLEAKKSYQWKVRAKGSVGIGEWSDSWQFSTEESVGVTEQAAEQGIRILPQPAGETLDIMGIEEKDVQIVIADMQGRLLLSTEATHINISGLTDGVYTCRINAGGKIHCLCFSVVR